MQWDPKFRDSIEYLWYFHVNLEIIRKLKDLETQDMSQHVKMKKKQIS